MDFYAAPRLEDATALIASGKVVLMHTGGGNKMRLGFALVLAVVSSLLPKGG